MAWLLVVLASFALIWFILRENGKERLLFRDSLDKNSEVIREFSRHSQQILSAQLEGQISSNNSNATKALEVMYILYLDTVGLETIGFGYCSSKNHSI